MELIEPITYFLLSAAGRRVDEQSVISEVDTKSGKLAKELPIDAAHVEAMALEKSGSRLYINVTDKNYLAVWTGTQQK